MAGSSFSYDSTDTDHANYGYARILNIPEQTLPPPNLDVQNRGSSLGGAVVQGVSFGPRTFSWDVLIRGTSRANLFTCLDNLKTLLNPANGEKLLQADDWTGLATAVNRACYAVVNGPIQGEPVGSTAMRLTIPWLVRRGLMVTAAAQGQTDSTIDSDPKTIYEPTAADGVVLGNHDAEPVITIKNTSGGTITSLVVANTTTSESLEYTGSLQNNWYFKIDTERMHCEYSTDGTTYVTAMGSVATDQDFIHLDAGSRNTLTVTGLSAGEITIAYRGLFL